MSSFYMEIFLGLMTLIGIICLTIIHYQFVKYEENPVKYYGPPAMFFFMLDFIYIISGKGKYYYSLNDKEKK